MKLEQEAALVEAILFLESEPQDLSALCRISGLSRDVVLETISHLQQRYSSPAAGIEIVQIADGFLLAPKASLWEHLRKRYGKRADNTMSRAALETLSIVAYSQPVTKNEIESIRGVSPDGMLRLLQEKNLIRVVGKKDVPGKPVQFGTTPEFLKAFRLSSISDLPRLDELDQERFELDGR